MKPYWVYVILGVIGGLIAFGIVAIYTPSNNPVLEETTLITTSSCDIKCKEELEKKGYTCYLGANEHYFCKFKNSEHATDVVIPVGASDPVARINNYIPSIVKVSLGINSTVQWTNVDDAPSSVISNDGLFDSGPLGTNMTWAYPFDKVGTYEYHSEPHPWMKGQVIVIPIDLDYKKGEPIQYYGGEPEVTRFIFREMNAWGYITNMRVIDSNTVVVSLLYSNGTSEAKTLKIGDNVLGSCGFVGGRTQLYFLNLDIIDFNYGLAEFREEVAITSSTKCPHS